MNIVVEEESAPPNVWYSDSKLLKAADFVERVQASGGGDTPTKTVVFFTNRRAVERFVCFFYKRCKNGEIDLDAVNAKGGFDVRGTNGCLHKVVCCTLREQTLAAAHDCDACILAGHTITNELARTVALEMAQRARGARTLYVSLSDRRVGGDDEWQMTPEPRWLCEMRRPAPAID